MGGYAAPTLLLTGYSDGETSATYTYDDMGRKLTETVNYPPALSGVEGFSKSFSYTYYGNGQKHTFTAPDGMVYTYHYGDNNELRQVQIPGVGAVTIPDYTWNRPAKMVFPGGTQRMYGYDALMRLASLTATDPGGNPLLEYAYTYDHRGNMVTKDTEHGNYGYGYDAASRLTSADNPVLADEAYTYDNVGNRLTAADVSGSWNYNLNNELLGYADVTYDYDDNGNLTRISIAGSPVWTYEYDAVNRLIRAEDGTETITANYGYDPFGRRLWKEVGGTKTYFFYSEEGLIAEYDASGNEIRSYGYKPDSTWTTDPLWLKAGGAYYWYQNDHLGTPQKLVAGNGAVVWSTQYTAFGEAQIEVETVTNNLRFPGQYEDVETGLLYNFQRYYDPKLGRYLRVDPIGFIGGDANWYGYGGNNPAKISDPYGLLREKDVKNGRSRYSCTCGWVDKVHAHDARETLFRPIWKAITNYTPTDSNWINLQLYQARGLVSFTGIYALIQPPGTETRQKIQLALDILFDFEVAFENYQYFGGVGQFVTHSSFSVDDLPSDFLGFMQAIRQNKISEQYGIDDMTEHLETFCQPVLDTTDSLKLFELAKKFEKVSNTKLPRENWDHHPKLWVKGAFRKYLEDVHHWIPCGCKDPEIPAIFSDWCPNSYNRDNPSDYAKILLISNWGCHEDECYLGHYVEYIDYQYITWEP